MAEEFPKVKRPTLILVTGLPNTGCVWTSQRIADWARCPWLKHEVILDSLSENGGYHIDNLPSEEDASRLQRLAFDITCSTARSQLSECAPTECVLISSFLLSYKSQLLRLLDILQRNSSDRVFLQPQPQSQPQMQPKSHPRRLLIIECLKRNRFTWQRIVDQDHRTLHGESFPWYEPTSWKDVEKAILHHQQEGLDAYFLTLLQDTPPDLVDAIKLVLDPSEDLNTQDLFFTSKPELDRRSLFIEAIKDLLTCDDVHSYGDGSHVVDYPLWRRQRLEEQSRSFAFRVTSQHHWCPKPGECIFRLTHNLSQQEEATCEICDGKIPSMERTYYCQFCSLSFHQACCCASPAITADKLSQVLDSIEHGYDEVFPDTNACYSCIREERGFSGRCDSCIYRTTLKSRLLSPILRHSCDQDHILTMSLTQDTQRFLYCCKACGRLGKYSAYYCNICTSEYHMECLHLPLLMEHPHGGHLHKMKIEFSCTKEGEYEWCLACYKDINPQTWVYTCQECDYVAHLYCVFPFLSQRFLPSPF